MQNFRKISLACLGIMLAGYGVYVAPPYADIYNLAGYDWAMTGIIWMAGSITTIFYLQKLQPNLWVALAGIISGILGIFGFIFLLTGIGIASGDSEPWDHLPLIFSIGSVLAGGAFVLNALQRNALKN